ncbi:MAG TPA: carboxylesterase family protein [bacterium]|nr:carboxylesterase family protein [bacterium]
MKNRMLLVLGMALVLVTMGGAARAVDVCSVPAPTQDGMYQGMSEPDYGACVYRGIPFARPPVGELRLARPEPAEAHEGVAEAFEFGPACPQEEDILNGGKAGSYGEDCLYLNVWRPAKSGVFPVLVWIYGGGFVGGAGSFDIYDGAHLATREDVVVVTLNYRLGALGFLALPELAAKDAKGSTGNYGIMDQARALTWVRDNIASFGGDPGNVTVFGQSAGGMSVCALLVSPEAQGLFHRAMIMSGPCRLVATEDEGYKKGRALAEKLGCAGPDVVSCLREKPMAAFSEKGGNDLLQGGVSWSPTIDGSFLPELPVKMIEEGRYQKVPVIIGTTRDELRSYTMMVPGLGLWTRGTVNRLMKALTGPNYDAIMAMYDYGDFRRPIDVAFAFGNQMVFDTPEFMMAEAMAGNNPVYLYRFDWDHTRFPHKMGAMHAIDVPFVFGAFNPDTELVKLLATKKIVASATPLGYQMMDYLANFARTGDPNGASLPAWPAYTREKRERLYVNTDTAARPLSDLEVRRYQWFANRELKDVLAGPFSKLLGGGE